RGPAFGSGTPAARDIVVSPDDRWIYVTLAGGTLEGIAADRTRSGPVGFGSSSYAANVGPTSQFAACGGAAEGRIFDVSGTPDPAPGRVLAHVGPVAEGDYETRISAFRGTEVAVADWTITVDTTPPDFRLDPVPSVVESDVLDLTGTVIDSHLFWVRVGSSYPI